MHYTEMLSYMYWPSGRNTSRWMPCDVIFYLHNFGESTLFRVDVHGAFTRRTAHVSSKRSAIPAAPDKVVLYMG